MIARAQRWLVALALAGWLAALPLPGWAATYLIDSSAGVPTTYPWIDISTTGTTVALTDDSQSAPIYIGFTFPFGGIGVTDIIIGSNGWQFFTTGSNLYTNTDFPVGQELLTLPYWDDLNPGGVASYIRYQTVGTSPNRIFVVSYLNIPHYCGSGTGCTSNQTTTKRETFQVQYHEATGDIIFWYQAMNTLGGGWTTGPVPAGGLPEPGATIGLELGDADYTKWSYNTNSIANGMALRFYYTTPYVTPVPFAWYRMDETSWGAVIDSSGNGLNGVVAGTGVTPTGYPHVTPPNSAKTGDPGTCGSEAISAGTTARGVDGVFDMNGVGNIGSISFWYSGNAAWNDGNNRMLFDASNDLGGNDAADRQFYLVKTTTGALRFSLEDSANTESAAVTGNNTFAANTWHHIAVTWNLGLDRVRIYLDGVLAATSTTNVNGTLGDMLSLYIGGWRGGTISGATNYTTNSANGYIDEVRIYNTELTLQDVVADRGRTHSCGTGLHHYSIAVSPSTQVGCLPVAVTITGHTNTHTATAPGTTINLTTSTGKGTWTLSSGTGTLTDTTADDGAASYQFGSGETAVTLNLFHPTLAANPQTVNINVSDVTRSEDGTEDPNISMQRAALVLYNATDASAAIPVQIAGKRSDTGFNAKAIELRALRQSDSNPTVCNGMFPGQTKAVQLGFECITPATCAGQTASVSFDGGALQAVATNNSNGVSGAPAYSTLNLTFDANSREQLVLFYPDAGLMRLNARTSLTAAPTPTYVDGETDFVVRPFGFGFTSINKGGTANPGGTASAGTAFTTAGSTFAATVGAYLWASGEDADNDGVPDSGANVTDNGLTPNYAYATTLTPTIHTPASGAAGTLGGTTSILAASFSGGQATVSDLAWSEVGSLYLDASVANYLGASGAAISGRSGGVGRFYPAYFSLASSAVTAANAGGFSYMAQPGLQIAYTLQAHKTGGGVTTNYDNNTLGFSLVAAPALVAENANAGTSLASRLATSATPKWTGGVYTFSDTTASFGRAAAPDGPYDSLQLGVTTSGGDGAAIQSLDMKATTTGNCSTVPDCDARQIGSATKVRFGRLRLSNAFGPATGALAMPVQAQYWSGSSWVLNGADSSTTLPANAFFLTGGPAATTTAGAVSLAGGQGTLTLTNTGSAGSVDVAANLGTSGSDQSCLASHGATASNRQWLRSRNGDCAATYDRDPSARGTFGIYAPESRRAVHVREQF